MGIDKNISGPFVEVYEKLIFTKSMILGQWTEASVSSPGGGYLLFIFPDGLGSDREKR